MEFWGLLPEEIDFIRCAIVLEKIYPGTTLGTAREEVANYTLGTLRASHKEEHADTNSCCR
jgi:hypothetical protein